MIRRPPPLPPVRVLTCNVHAALNGYYDVGARRLWRVRMAPKIKALNENRTNHLQRVLTVKSDR